MIDFLKKNWPMLVVVGAMWGRMETRLDHVELDISRIWAAVMPGHAQDVGVDTLQSSDNLANINHQVPGWPLPSVKSLWAVKSAQNGADDDRSNVFTSDSFRASPIESDQRPPESSRLPGLRKLRAEAFGFP